MNFIEAVSFTYPSLSANKMRAGLTMLGMVIGTASIILIVTIALIGRDYILQQTQGIGSNLIYLDDEAVATMSGPKALSDGLTESAFMATAGGAIGILLGISGPLIAKALCRIEIPISLNSIFVAFMLSLVVGVTFGLIPANRASKLNPTEALRYE